MCHRWDGNAVKASTLSALDVSTLWWKCCQGKHLIITGCVTTEMQMLSRQALYHHWMCHNWDGTVVMTRVLSSLDVSSLRWNVGKARALSSLDVSLLRWKCCQGWMCHSWDGMLSRQAPYHHWMCHCWDGMLARQEPYHHWMCHRCDGNVVKASTLSSLDVSLLRLKCCQDKHLIITRCVTAEMEICQDKHLIITGCVTAEMEMLSRQAPYHHWMCHHWDGNVVKARALSSLDVSLLWWKCCRDKHLILTGCVSAEMEMLSRKGPYHHWMCHCWDGNVVKTSTFSSLNVSLLRWKCCQDKHLIITECVTAEMEMLSRQAPYHHWMCHRWDGNVLKTSTIASVDVSPLTWKCCQNKSLIITDVSKAITAFHSTSEEEDRCLMNILFGFKFSSVPLL